MITPTESQAVALDELIQWFENPTPRREISLSGPAGTGKTVLTQCLNAAVIAAQAMV